MVSAVKNAVKSVKTVTSRDGTLIAYDRLGSGPPLVLVDGAFCHRTFGPMPKLAPLLARHFDVVHFDRRGRGASGKGDTPWSVEREIEDIEALVGVLGGEAFVYGTSSGAVLAARAVASGSVKAKKLALHEPPLALDGTHYPQPTDYIAQIDALLAANEPVRASKLFMKVVGVPAFGIFMMGLMPSVMKNMREGAPTLPHDFGILGDTQRGGPMPDELSQTLRRIDVPTLTLVGGKSPPWMHHAVKRVVDLLPKAAPTKLLPKQDHNVAASAMGPALVEFFLT